MKLKITFLKIGTIDTIKDRFSADIMVVSKWREMSLDGKMRVGWPETVKYYFKADNFILSRKQSNGAKCGHPK